MKQNAKKEQRLQSTKKLQQQNCAQHIHTSIVHSTSLSLPIALSLFLPHWSSVENSAGDLNYGTLNGYMHKTLTVGEKHTNTYARHTLIPHSIVRLMDRCVQSVYTVHSNIHLHKVYNIMIIRTCMCTHTHTYTRTVQRERMRHTHTHTLEHVHIRAHSHIETSTDHQI